MAKKKNKAKQNGRKPMTTERLAEVGDWLENMNRHLEKAVQLSNRIDGDNLDESDDLFWALVKYAENVQECILQLDKINSTILLVLDEIPEEASADIGFIWKGMKGMRQRLAHDFREIDPEILWQTVTNDFPILQSLVSKVIVPETSFRDGEFGVRFNAGAFRTMPVIEEKEVFKPGNSMIALYFDKRHKAQCVRIARVDDRTVKLAPSDDITFTNVNFSLVDQDGTVEQLGGWP